MILNQCCSETLSKILFQQYRSDSVFRRCPLDVQIAAASGPSHGIIAGRKSANKRHSHKVHSITSLAPERKSGEIARARARAVRKLTMKSNLAGSSIGSSPGLAPRRMRST
jgi:hypothetical protein